MEPEQRDGCESQTVFIIGGKKNKRSPRPKESGGAGKVSSKPGRRRLAGSRREEWASESQGEPQRED